MSRRLGARHGSVGAHRARTALVGLGAAVAVAVTGIAVGGPVSADSIPAAGGPAAAAGMVQAAPATTVTTTTDNRSLTVAVSPNAGLPPSGAQITVAGKGFDPSHDLWVAVCQDDGVAPKALLHCIGGAIPDQNTTTGWGIVTDAKQPPYPGPVVTGWHQDGSFQLTLHLPSAISESADCVSAPCSVFTRSSDDSDRSEDVGVPVTFAPPPGESSQGSSGQATPSTSTSTQSSAVATTQTFGVVPTTVTPDSMLQTSVVAGGSQTVVFTGFTPGEKVDVTLYSEPVKLPAATADRAGNVRITFTVPKNLPAGEHILQAIGTKSGRVGIARFSVTAPTPSASASSSAPASSSAVASQTVSAQASAVAPVVTPTASASVAPSTTSVATSSQAAPSTAAATSSSAAAGATGLGNRLLWLWIVLAVLVLVGGAAAVVAMVRRRREDEDDLPLTQATAVAPAPGWSAAPGPGDDPGGETATMTDPGGGFGLLSGRHHPDGPALLSGGGWSDQPTQAIGGHAGGAPGGAAGGPPAGPSTEQWRPDFTGEAPVAGSPSTTGGMPPAAEPRTQQWRPDFTDESPVAGAPPAEQVPPADREWPSGDDSPSGGRHRSG